MQPWEMTAFCPLCKSVFKASKVRSHINSKHPEATNEQKTAVQNSATLALQTCKASGKVASKNAVNATDVLIKSKQRVGFTWTVSGGAFGLGKRK